MKYVLCERKVFNIERIITVKILKWHFLRKARWPEHPEQRGQRRYGVGDTVSKGWWDQKRPRQRLCLYHKLERKLSETLRRRVT